MLKKTIPYIDLNGVERKEDFYFHLSKPEIVKMQTSVKGGYDVQLKSIGAGADGGDRELLANDFRLCALTRAGCSQKNEIHIRAPF